jgi:hypothetical protein
MTLGLLLAGALLPPLRRAIALLRILLMLLDLTSTLAHEGIHGAIQGWMHGAMQSAIQRAIDHRAAAMPAIVTVSEPTPTPSVTPSFTPSLARARPLAAAGSAPRVFERGTDGVTPEQRLEGPAGEPGEPAGERCARTRSAHQEHAR